MKHPVRTVPIVLLGVAIGVIALAGCGSTSRQPAQIVGAATPNNSAAGNSAATANTVSTRGVGTATGVPDTLDLVLGVQTTAATAAAALDSDNAKANALINSLMKAGVAKKDIQTRQLDIQPVYAPKSQTITGYQVTNTVRATMRALSSAGAAIDAAARAAGNAVRVEQLTFSIGDQSKLLAAARVLVNPAVLDDFELDLMSQDFRVWTVHTTTTFPDAPQAAMQIRRALIDWSGGRWELAADWVVVWITFGESWLDGDNPIPWPAHSALWNKLAEYSDNVRYNLGLGGVPRLQVPRESH
jgi:hypothetical protein